MVKGGFNQARMNAIPDGFMLKMYTCEAMWYREVAPKMKEPVEVVKCWWSGADATNAIVILDDLEAKGCTFGDAVNNYGVDWVCQALEQLAGMHASTWGTKAEDITWFDMNNYTNAMLGMLSMWDMLVLDRARPPLPPHFKDQAWVTRLLKKHWRNVNPKTRALLHNDPHASNTFMTHAPASAPRFLEFQNIAVGSALGDVAYCIGSAMTVPSRREHEWALLDHYLKCLAAQGGPTLGREEVMAEYRKGYLMGLGWILTPYAWHSVERVTEMSSRYVAALIDHKSMELVEEMEEMKGHN
ncbi:kinase-like domain-containing protein [Xylariales sp. PMI_506]|nr:kinase-like domain-containing protein [Xylariales sp. PMI_506]